MFAAGYMCGLTFDRGRSAWRSSSPRPLAWSAWYPADPATPDVQEKLLGAPGRELFRMGMIAEDAPISNRHSRWPIVLLSHGTGGTADAMGWLGIALAQQGYIAVGVSHHGNTAVEPYVPEGFLCWWERSRDLTALLDALSEHSALTGKVDFDKVFAAGFSLGGYTVLAAVGAITQVELFEKWRAATGGPAGPREFPDLAEHVPALMVSSAVFRDSMERQATSYLDSRIRAVVAIAPAPPVRSFEPESLRSIRVPVLLIGGHGDMEAPVEHCASWLKSQNSSFELSLMPQDAGHAVFLPEATPIGKTLEPALCIDAHGVNRAEIHSDAARQILRHFMQLAGT